MLTPQERSSVVRPLDRTFLPDHSPARSGRSPARYLREVVA